ncbi:SPOR domain-containing protein [Guyparkeria halopsychrophila]|uniref:SPOR domain-containing protein n=1 Tax=Guyparkeria halopsychrophila TaxID=3139421 RepID=UPI0037CAF466
MAEQIESSWTESRFRQRLVGASVVVALAVLLLPLWLDGSGIDSLRVQPAPEKPTVEGVDRIEVPQPPGETGEPLENPPTSLFPDQTPIEAREGGETIPYPTESEAPAPNEDAVEAASAAEESADDRSRAAEATDDLPAESPAEPDADSKASADAAPTESPEAAKSEGDSASSGENLPEISASGEYVVQLGSFSDERNARALAKSVESSGFDVSVTPLFSEQGTVWRVRVGPYATRDLAGEATERLRQRIGRDGLVMTK